MRIVFKAFLTSALVVVTGCSEKSPPTVRQNMRDAYSASTALYGYVWSRSKFEDPKNQDTIVSLLDRLSRDFHRVEKVVPVTEFEPGFRNALQVNHEIIRDATERFKAGQNDYARWRLRGLTSSCIGCHTRYQVSSLFDGITPEVDRGSPVDKLEGATFLVATRQFEKASAELWNLAGESLRQSKQSETVIEPLGLWLVVQLRVQSHYETSARSLQSFVSSYGVTGRPREILRRWVQTIKAFPSQSSSNLSPEESLKVVNKLLQGAKDWESADDEDRNLPTLLLATGYLHPLLLRQDLTEVQRRTATYLLALSYSKINLQSFAVFRDMYLEQCIRDFPNSDEARDSFERLKSEVELRSSGSSGIYVTPEDQARLNELRQIAYGKSSMIVNDAGPVS